MVPDIRFFYYRDKDRRPLITVCRLTSGIGHTAYGWAICGPKDNPHKWAIQVYDATKRSWHIEPGGCDIAHGRDLRALKQGKLSLGRRIVREEAKRVLDACQACGLHLLATQGIIPRDFPRSMQPMMAGGLHGAEQGDGTHE